MRGKELSSIGTVQIFSVHNFTIILEERNKSENHQQSNKDSYCYTCRPSNRKPGHTSSVVLLNNTSSFTDGHFHGGAFS